MKHILVTVVLLAASTRAVGDAANDERDLTKLVKDLAAAIQKGDVTALERVLGKDYVHIRGNGSIEERAEYIENRKNGKVKYDSLSFDDIKVRLHGDTAIVTGRATRKGKDQQGGFDNQVRWTRTFVRKDGRWQAVAFQATPIQKQ